MRGPLRRAAARYAGQRNQGEDVTYARAIPTGVDPQTGYVGSYSGPIF
jgi:hypothetical protein